MHARPRRPRGASRPHSSSMPTSSPRPASPCPSATALTASRSRPARRRPTWTWRRRRACSACEQIRVRIRPSACGGGFGGKLDVSVQPLLAVAAWVTKRPVRIVYTRTESMASTTKRHPATHPGAGVGRRARPAHGLRDAGRFQHGRLCLVGADGGEPGARARHGAVQGARTRTSARARSTPTRRRPALSAASACRRRPSRMRR